MQEEFIELLKSTGVEVSSEITGQRMGTFSGSLVQLVQYIKDGVKSYDAAGISGVELDMRTDAFENPLYYAVWYMK